MIRSEPSSSDHWSPLNPGVDAGGASAIALALHQRKGGRDGMLLIDERCGRAEARRLGLALIGTAAVLVLAKERGLVSSCEPLLLALREQGYNLSDSLIAEIDCSKPNRSPFVAEAMNHELAGRRRADVLLSLDHPHPGSLAAGTRRFRRLSPNCWTPPRVCPSVGAMSKRGKTTAHEEPGVVEALA